MRLLISKQIDPRRFIAHRFGFDEFVYAYDVVSNETRALVAVLAVVEHASVSALMHPAGAPPQPTR